MLSTRFMRVLAVIGFAMFLVGTTITLPVGNFGSRQHPSRLVLSAVSLAYNEAAELSYYEQPILFNLQEILSASAEMFFPSDECLVSWVSSGPSTRAMIAGDELHLPIKIYNSCKFSTVQVEMSIEAPDFTIEPNNQVISIAPSGTYGFTWELRAKQPGVSRNIVININMSAGSPQYSSNPDNSKIETPVLRENRGTENSFSVIVLPSFSDVIDQLLEKGEIILGPMLTIPWWYEQWKKRRKQRTMKKANQASERASSHCRKKRKATRV